MISLHQADAYISEINRQSQEIGKVQGGGGGDLTAPGRCLQLRKKGTVSRVC